MAPNHKQYESIPSHNAESQALIADEAIEQGFSPCRRPLLALFLGIALATIAVGSSIVHQTFSAHRVQINVYDEHITVLRKELNEVKSKLEHINSNVARLVGDEFKSRDLEGSLSVGEQCFSDNSCSSGSCITKPYAFCSGAPTTSPIPGTVGRPCNYNHPQGTDCSDGLYCPIPTFSTKRRKYESFCTKLRPTGSLCWKSFECASQSCSGRCDEPVQTKAQSPHNPAHKGRCGPKFDGRRCDCTGNKVYCNIANGWCGNTTAHRDAQKGEVAWDCKWTD